MTQDRVQITRQTQTEHLGDYFTLRTAIAVHGGEIEVAQRLEDNDIGYATGKARISLIVLALRVSESVLFGDTGRKHA